MACILQLFIDIEKMFALLEVEPDTKDVKNKNKLEGKKKCSHSLIWKRCSRSSKSSPTSKVLNLLAVLSKKKYKY